MSKNIDQIHSKKQLTKLVTQFQISNQLLDTMKQISYCVNYFHVLLKFFYSSMWPADLCHQGPASVY